jgi:hypothetical protein
MTDRTLIPIGPEAYRTPHDPEAAFLYRGYAIVGCAEGWDVLDPRASIAYARDPVGYGSDMFNAMAVVNELQDGTTRRISK